MTAAVESHVTGANGGGMAVQERRRWTSGEEEMLSSMAGRVPLRSIAAALGRSEASVRRRASEMRSRGVAVGRLRFHEPRCRPCPECGLPRSRFAPTGECECCRSRALLERYEAGLEEMLDSMPEEVRARTKGTARSSRARPPERRPRPSLEGLDAYGRSVAEDEAAMAEEAAELDDIRRARDAAKSAKRRWRRMLVFYRTNETAGEGKVLHVTCTKEE